MNEDVAMVLEMADGSMKSAISHLIKELVKIRAGKASPAMLEGILVEYYGAQTPLNQLSNVTAPDARTLSIQPFDKSALQNIEKAIMMANLGLNPQNNGEVILINVPQLTEERRRDLVKQAKSEGEHAKVSIRNARKEANDEVKKLEKDEISEDEAKDATAEVQKLTDGYSKKVDDLLATKESEIMTI